MSRLSRPTRAALWGAVATLALGSAAGAVKPTVREHAQYAQFSTGEADGTALSSAGPVTLSPPLDSVATLEAQRIWSLARAADGTAYAGTGDDGRVYRLPVRGGAELLFDSPEVAVHALRLGPDGALYAGTAPDGLVYRIGPGGQAETWARTGAHYVWDLAFDARSRLVAATGDPGQVVRALGGGRVEILAAPGDRHVMALAAAGEHLYAATAGAARDAGAAAGSGTGGARGARVYEIEADGRARLLAEVDYQEINRLLALGGALYATAVSPVSGPGDGAASAVLRLDPAGATTVLWKVDAMAHDLAPLPDGDLAVAVADPGRLYQVQLDGRQFALLHRDEGLTPHRLLGDSRGLLLGDAQSGRLLRLGPGLVPAGRYDGPVEDFVTQARWGALEWRGTVPPGASLRFRTRSGNGREPDATWSDWSDPLPESGVTIASPPARYLQYRAELGSGRNGAAPRLDGVGLTAEQVNLAPEIGELVTFPYRPGQPGGNGNQENAAAAAAAAQARGAGGLPPSKTLRVVRWEASDPNGDDLVYDVYLRSDRQTTWKMVEEGLDKTSVFWDTEDMPEGLTRLRLVASDRPDNADGGALAGERLSDPFPIDNSPPVVTVAVAELRPGTAVLQVALEDAVTAVRGARYTIDYGDRQYQIEPEDGIYDRRLERARFAVTDLAPGEHVISVQAWDELENLGVAQAIVVSEPAK
ncbi:MAG: hypothetical protein ABIL09_28735 [Gemmatimonadota bacterium]